ncbi:MAG: hypothetical protein EOP88_16240 [Verrucomicrobiaceae bacterium]|nr:MAG: hypothetical protein EOP88_16240 [Verrucomicrobiaceae bacterium]
MDLTNPLRCVVIPVLLAVPVHLSAQVMKMEPKEGMHDATFKVSGPRPLFDLPVGIPSEAGATTCHAQVSAILDGQIPIYLINRTERETSIGLTGLDTSLRAYRKLDNGKWERVQPANGWVMCADSDRRLAIPPGMFVSASVACPSSGTPATLRYQIGDSWLSNEFPGFFSPDARDMAQRDLRSPYDCPTWGHILKAPASPSDGFNVLAATATETLLPVEQRLPLQAAAIDLLQQYADFRAARLACDDALTMVDKLPEPLKEAASKRFTDLKSRPAVAVATDLEFASLCLGHLRTKPAAAVYGDLSQHPGTVWQALAWLDGHSPDPASLPWAEILTLWKERIPTASLPELEGMAKFLENSRLANEHVSGQILISLLQSESPAMRMNSVRLLLERNMDRALAEAAAGLDGEGKSVVIRQVAADRERFMMRHGPLNEFLIASAKADPVATFEAFDRSLYHDKPANLEPGLHLAFGDFFTKTVSVGLEGPVRIGDYMQADRIRRCMRYVEHRELLKKLADSEAYQMASESVPAAQQDFFVAREARRQWARLGYEP